MTSARARIVALGKCPGPKKWAKEPDVEAQIWKPMQGSKLVINGVELHRSHNLNWFRGLAYCTKCGHYSAGGKVEKLAYPCELRVGECPTTQYRLNRIVAKQCPIKGVKLAKEEVAECPTNIRPHLGNHL